MLQPLATAVVLLTVLSGCATNVATTADKGAVDVATADTPVAAETSETSETSDTSTSPEPARPAMGMGNGEANWILTDGATRAGATFTFPEVHIDGNGWLVMHPFENGAPNGDIYVGATYVSSGDNRNVAITVEGQPASGDMYIVMLHRDVDEDRNFDFVFVGDTGHVEDKAVFEGSTMIGHAYVTP